MIKSEDRNGLSMRKRTKLSAKLVFKDLYSEVRNGLCLPFLLPVMAYIDLTRKQLVKI